MVKVDRVARLLLEELEAAFLQQWEQRRHVGGADLFPGPAMGVVVYGVNGAAVATRGQYGSAQHR